MAPSESEILNNFLLVPSQLPAIISLQEFTALFPRSQQSSPHIRALYRDLQGQRNAVVDSVASNIEAEVRRAKGLRRAVVRARREAESQEYDDEIEIERTVRSDKTPLTSLIREIKKMILILPQKALRQYFQS
jgi:centromere-localized protein 2